MSQTFLRRQKPQHSVQYFSSSYLQDPISTVLVQSIEEIILTS